MGMMVSRLIAGTLVTRIGFRRMLLIGTCGLILFSLGYFIAATPTVLFFVRFCNGFSYGLTANTCITIVSTISPQERSGEAIGYYTMSQMVSWAFGPAIGIDLLQSANYTGLFLFCAILPVIGLAFLPFLRLRGTELAITTDEKKLTKKAVETSASETLPPGGTTKIWMKLFDFSVLPAIILCFSLFLFNTTVTSFLAVYAESIGLEKAASLFFLVYVVALLSTRPYVSKRFDKNGLRAVLYPGAIVFIAAFWILSQVQNVFLLFVVAAFYGAGGGAMHTAMITWAVKLAPRHRLSVANATFFMAVDFVSAMGPVIGGAVIMLTDYRTMFFIGGAYALLGLIFFHLILGRKVNPDGKG
jgi:MFS family permease